MLELPGYRMREKLGGNGEFSLFRLMRLEDGQSVIAKTTREALPDPHAVAAFRYEYERMRELDGKGAMEALDLLMSEGRPVLLMRDIGGSTLAEALRGRVGRADLRLLVGVAAAAARSMTQLHQAKLTLNELTPSHLFANADTMEVKFVDIRKSSSESAQGPLFSISDVIDDALPYIAPEQTGRTGVEPDYRSDFYSLGVVLYEWFSGSLPFKSRNVLDTVHQHLAATPQPLYHRAPELPRLVSDIVGKCLEKSPDARYVSAFGIHHDLQTCFERLQGYGVVEPFKLASRDIPDRWTVPSRLYGREFEQNDLREALRRAADGASEIVWVIGSGGVGKTSFVMETLRSEWDDAGFFASGKFEANHAVRPYEVWIQAIEQLADQLLMGSAEQAEAWRLGIEQAVEGHGQLLLDLVPRLALLIGPQPFLQPLAPTEAQRRFQKVLTRFLQQFLLGDRPMILFFDDLQWADDASMQFLGYFLEDRETKHLLVIGAYREEEVQEHPLTGWESMHARRAVGISAISLSALKLDDLNRLLRDALRDDDAKTDELAEHLLRHTEGNPFLLKRLLQDFVVDRQVAFDAANRNWHWNMDVIYEMNVADNAVDYISVKLMHLPDNVAFALGYAAILGGRFDIKMLALLTLRDREELRHSLDRSVQEGFLQLLGGENRKYRFKHDRIRQAALALIAEEDRIEPHLRIGTWMADRLEAEEDAGIFEAVNHLNQARKLFEMPEQRLQLAELNVRAGMAAKRQTAYETALGYLRIATELMGPDGWEIAYSFTFKAFRERAETEYLCAQFETADRLFRLTLSKASTKLEQAYVYEMMIRLASSQDLYTEVISLSRKTLELLDVRNPFYPNAAQSLIQWLRVRRKIKKHPVETISGLPPMEDEARKLAMSVLGYATNACFNENKRGWFSASLLMVEMTFDEGLAPESALGFVGYAMFQYFAFHKHEDTFKWGEMACELSKPYPLVHVKTLAAFSICIDSWRRYEPEMLQTFTDRAGKVGLESGDLWHSNQSVLLNGFMLLQFGYPMNGIYERLIAHSGDLRRNQSSFHWAQATLFAELLVRLTGYRSPDDPYPIENVLGEDYIDSIQGDPAGMIRELICVCRYIPGYIYGRFEDAKEALAESLAIIESRKDTFEHSMQYLYESLVWAQLYEDAGKEERRVYLRGISKRLKSLSKYAKRSPENYFHKYAIIRAEYSRLKKKYGDAERYYEQAIEAGRKYGHIHDVAMAAECFAKYASRQGKLPLAKAYMAEARDAYANWGAAPKVAELEREYPHLLQAKRESGLERVDYLSVALSAQALSGEIEMGPLLDKLLRIMLRNAGAEFGAILFEHEGDWTIEAHGTSEALRVASIPADEKSGLVPSAIIGYAIRTRNEILLDDAAGEGLFARNPQVRSKGLKSVLCLPILYQKQLVCVLYLENKLSPGVFTPERLDVLKLLASQCAISIANAKLYAGIQYLKNSLEEQVEDRTRSLERSMKETAAALAEVSVYEERNRIAGEIHDIVGHTLTSTLLQIEAGKRLLSKDAESATARLRDAQDLVRHGLNEIRGSIHMLKEEKFTDLVPTLKQLIRETEHNTGVVVHAEIGELPELSTVHKKAIYYALQEGMTNGIRHGSATVFRFVLATTESLVRFALEDNGKGAEDMRIGFGLNAMKDRAEQLGGSLNIQSRPGEGCLLIIEIPYSKRRNGGSAE
ncbi:GAF domain-containing protein [Cohnella endophytica]|uniref:GAF domain-containing protein n=1 Tax=Cohnella endophytica TaxID=2419778 RepID=A0A494XLN3_9BACL|nr:AAA family ATPase [Cohnella endophytica]RKP51605.1 GAF domain-containing protein [Cohnella endophytica]